MSRFHPTRLAAAAVALTWLSLSAPVQAAVANADTIRGTIQASLDQSLVSFNKGDYQGYLHDFAPRITYNGLQIERQRLVEINQELRQSFPDLKMRYNRIHVTPLSGQEANATTVAEFTGSTANYDNSGLPASYKETGEVTSIYTRENNGWFTHQLEVSWNDSLIEIGQAFGVLGFSALPPMTGGNQPFRFRLFVGDDERQGFGVSYAYAIAPLKSVLDKAGADEVFKQLKFKPVPYAGVDVSVNAPKGGGTYAHVLVLNKYWRAGNNESIVGQKIYTRLLRVLD